MADKRKKKKISPAMIVLITLLSLTFVTFFIVLCAFFAGTMNKEQKESYVGSGVINELATENVSVKINMENCTMTVGTKVTVTATIYPGGSTAGIMWASSDESVFTIDSKGNLEVVGTGIVALTASFGDAYDSIAIECVEDEKQAVLNLPDYSMFTVNGGNNTVNNSSNQATQSQTEGSATEKTTASETIPHTQQETTAAKTEVSTTAAVQPTTAAQPVTTAAPTKPPKNETQQTTSYVIETTPPYEGEKVLSTDIVGKLGEYGFKQYLENTYVYEENDAYLGEIIISSNMAHIYIKERSTGFDNAVSAVLKDLLPDSHDSVWNIYTGASSDQTMTVDGRVVRVVVSGDSGHSQIVIYN